MIKKILISGFVFLVFSFSVTAAEDRALFWRVDSASTTVYLFGSIHFANESFYPLRAEIEKAFDQSQNLVVEVDVDSPQSMAGFQQLMLTEGMYSGDKTLKDDISKETFESLQHYLKKLSIPFSLVEKMKPGIVVLTLASAQAEQAGLNADQGIDAHFLAKAKNKKNVLSLETLEEQLKIFLDIENADALLRDSFHSFDMLDQEMDELARIWKRGDEQALIELLHEEVEGENAETADEEIIALYDRLYFQRNIKMSSAIESFLKQKSSYFVVVGAGHLVGEKGIIRLLRDADYRITRL